VSRIDAEALADCSIIYDRLVSSSCVAPRMSEHWQNVVVCRCSLHWPTCTLSCKYTWDFWEPVPVKCGTLTLHASLKSIRRLTGNQCSCLRTGVMCSRLPVRVSSRAAAFWTDCSFLSRVCVC